MALYEPDADHFVPTALTIGPWHSGLQHGGPPSGLLARAVERTVGVDGWTMSRFTVDLLRPIPLVPLRVVVAPERSGSQAKWLTARLLDPDDRVLARATSLHLRTVDLPLPPAHTTPRAAPALPGTVPRFVFPFFTSDVAFHRAVDLRLVGGTWPEGPITAWLKLVEPLVAGEVASPAQRAVVVCDAVNGIAPTVSIEEWGTGRFTFINADLSVHLRRPPRGDWLGMHARGLGEPDGVGQVQATLFDEDGEIGRCLESLVIRRARSAE